MMRAGVEIIWKKRRQRRWRNLMKIVGGGRMSRRLDRCHRPLLQRTIKRPMKISLERCTGQRHLLVSTGLLAVDLH